MTNLTDYQQRYADFQFERHDGLLEMTFSTDGGPLIWSRRAHMELPDAFADVAGDPDNRVVLMKGHADALCAEMDFPSFGDCFSLAGWSVLMDEGKRIINNLLSIPVPVVAAVEGGSFFHPELALLSDAIVAGESAQFRDDGHVKLGIVPGDGVQIIWQALFGLNRGRHLLLTNTALSAREALAAGAIGEVTPDGKAAQRARDIADDLLALSDLTLLNTRTMLIKPIKALFAADDGLGLALEGIAALENAARQSQEETA